jgi:hypothetical protein
VKQNKVDHYEATYATLSEEVYADVRARTFLEDYGQNGWQTSNELDLFVSWMQLDESKTLLEPPSGSRVRFLRLGAGASPWGEGGHHERTGSNRPGQRRRTRDSRFVWPVSVLLRSAWVR